MNALELSLQYIIEIESCMESYWNFESFFHELFLTLLYVFYVYVFMLFWILLTKAFSFTETKIHVKPEPKALRLLSSKLLVPFIHNWIIWKQFISWVCPLHYWAFIYFPIFHWETHISLIQKQNDQFQK